MPWNKDRTKFSTSEDPVTYLQEISVDKGTIEGYAYYVVPRPPILTGEILEDLKVSSPVSYNNIINSNLCTETYNGYIVFPKRPVKNPGYGGILQYVQVHGGITWYDEGPDGTTVYGFDTGHAYSRLVKSIDFIVEEIRHMLKGILKAAEVEHIYLNPVGSSDEERKAAIKAVVNVRGDINPETTSVFTLISLMSGKL